MSRLEESRRRFENAWIDLRYSLTAEVGWEPRWSAGWLLPIVGFAAGLALGLARVERLGRRALRRARRQRSSNDEG